MGEVDGADAVRLRGQPPQRRRHRMAAVDQQAEAGGLDQHRGVRIGGVERLADAEDSDTHAQLPILDSTSAFRKRSTNSMNPIDGTSRISAVIAAIW